MGINGGENLWGQEFMGTGYLLKFMGIYGDRLSIEIHGNSWGQVIY